MKYLFNFFIGIFIGCGAILPGVSSGVFCVIFGIYEKLVNSIVHFFSDFRKNLIFLFSLGFGAVIGIVLFGNIIKYFFASYKMISSFAFMGLILGTIPSLFKQAKNTNYSKMKTSGSNFSSTNLNTNLNFFVFNIKRIIPLILSFLIGIILIIFEKYFNFGTTVSVFTNSPLYLIFAGFIMSVGIVVPGISNTIILMCLGVYPEYISAVSSLNFHVLFPMCIGILFGSILWLKIITILLKKYHEATFYSIIGFTLGSLFVLYPGFSFNINGILSIFVLVSCTLISYRLSKYSLSLD